MLLERNSSSNQTNAPTSLLELQGNLSGDLTTEGVRIVMTLLYSITFLVGLVGNSLGMYVVCQKCGIKGATHLLIANLACSNLLITFIVMPMSVSHLYNGNRWHAGLVGSITCKLSQFLFLFPIAAAILTILVVSIDRFYAVFYPLNGQVFRRPKTMTATVWISSAILVSPSFVIFKAILFPDGVWRCVTYFGQDMHLASVLTKAYFSALFVMLYLLPLLIITPLYTLISCKLHRRKVPGQARCKNTRTTADKSKRKIVKVLVMIVLAFALCWFPAHVIHYYAIFKSDDYQRLPPYLHPLLLWVSHTNSAIDPCLYILLSQNFRREFHKVLTHCGYFQKRKQIEKRITRLTSNFSKRNWGSRRDSGFWSFPKNDGCPMSAGGKAQTVNLVGVLNWTPTGDRKLLQKVHDLAV